MRKHAKMGTALALALAFLAGNSQANAQETEAPVVNWVEGGGPVEVGEFSTLQLDPSLLYLNKEDTRAIQTYFGNIPGEGEVASVFPADENQNWFVLFEYTEEGHISDEEKSDIDAAALLDSYRQGTEEANEQLPLEHRLTVTGWHTEPFYDESSRTLIWALLAEDASGDPIVNYNVRTLAREGYVSTILVTGPESLDSDIRELETKIMPNYALNEGFRYEDFNPATDRMAEYGLTGLILGGAGLAVAKKTGLLVVLLVLLKKFWFVLLAIPAALWKFAKRRRQSPYHTNDGESTPPM
jgi:uncharacterized membrane-anchored protein